MKRSDSRSKSVTMADIAKELGISVVTVSNALSGKKGVSAHLRAAVVLKARELGYLEGMTADVESRSESRSGDIGIISPQRYLSDTSGFHWQLYQELITHLKCYDSYAILDIVSKEDELSLNTPRIIEKQLVSGIIILGCPEFKFLTDISKWGLPMVFLDFSVRDFDFASVVEDEYYDMYRLASLVISYGHSNICYVTQDKDELKRDRYYGYCRAAAESEMLPSRAQSLDDALSNFEIENPTAFICENRNIASELIERLEDACIAVPETVSVACFSDMLVEDGREITCVCRDSAKMARVAVDTLRVRLSDEGKNVGRVAVGGKLIIGNTTRSLII